MRGTVFRQCWCRDPETRKLLRKACPDLGKKGHGGWYARYDAPGEGGKRRQPVIGPFATKKDAEGGLADALSKTGAGMPVPDRAVLVGAYLETWLAGKVRIRERTRASYEEAVRLYWKPAIGHIRLVDLRDHHIAAAIAEIRKINREHGDPSETLKRLLAARAQGPGGRRSSVPLSPARIVRVAAPLSAALNDAVPSRLPFSPFDGVEAPEVTRVRPVPWTAERVRAFEAAYGRRLEAAGAAEAWQEVRIRIWASPSLKPRPVMVWLPADAGRFLEFIAGDEFYALFHLAALSGMRRSEIAALADAELRLGDEVISVADSKSPDGIRDIFPDPWTIEVLRAWMRQRAAWQLAWGAGWAGDGRVFTRPDGSPVPPQWMSTRFEVLAFQAGVPPVRFHDLRHLAASLGLQSGADMKVVAEQLGHARSDFTRDYYSVVSPAQARAAASAAAALIPRKGKG